MVHASVDLHKRVSQVAVLRGDGELRQYRVVNDPESLKGFFARLPAPTPVAIEASGTWWWLVDLLEGLGHRPVLSHPKQTKAVAAARLKNDRVDAERLVRLLRADLLPTVWIPPAGLREAREFIRHRVRLVWARTAVKNQLLALLARRNLSPTAAGRWLTMEGRQELSALPLDPIPSTVRSDCLALLGLLDEMVRRLDEELARRWGQDPRVGRLVTIPGIGPFTAILLVLELGEVSRFANAKKLASYLGLSPRVRASGERARHGHISKEGNRLLRWALVVAATQAARQPGPLRTWFRAVQRRRGAKVARVALARRLAEVVYHVWKGESDYFAVLRRGGVRG